MTSRLMAIVPSLTWGLFTVLINSGVARGDKGYQSQLTFPLQEQPVHGSTIVEYPNGDLLAAWFQGSGERWAGAVTLNNGRWALVYNNTQKGRARLPNQSKMSNYPKNG